MRAFVASQLIAALAVAGIITLQACSPKPDFIPTGKPMGAPIGAVDYCKRHPEAENCKDG